MLIAERVNDVLRRQLGEGFEWGPDSSLTAPVEQGGLDLDSLDIVQLIMGIENEFSVAIPDDAFWTDSGPRVGKVRDLVAYLETRLAARPALFA